VALTVASRHRLTDAAYSLEHVLSGHAGGAAVLTS